MSPRFDELKNKVVSSIDNDIEDYTQLLEILGDDNSIVDVKDKDIDIQIIMAKKKTAEGIKTLIMKTSLNLEGVNNETLLTPKEKKYFYRLVKFVMFCRKLTKPFRKK